MQSPPPHGFSLYAKCIVGHHAASSADGTSHMPSTGTTHQHHRGKRVLCPSQIDRYQRHLCRGAIELTKEACMHVVSNRRHLARRVDGEVHGVDRLWQAVRKHERVEHHLIVESAFRIGAALARGRFDASLMHLHHRARARRSPRAPPPPPKLVRIAPCVVPFDGTAAIIPKAAGQTLRICSGRVAPVVYRCHIKRKCTHHRCVCHVGRDHKAGWRSVIIGHPGVW
eukprot:3099159-Prymnesium_polylepis.1